MRQIFYHKMRDKSLLQNALGFLLQNAIVIKNCDNFITKCNSYYKMQRLLQIATVHALIKFLNIKSIIVLKMEIKKLIKNGLGKSLTKLYFVKL